MPGDKNVLWHMAVMQVRASFLMFDDCADAWQSANTCKVSRYSFCNSWFLIRIEMWSRMIQLMRLKLRFEADCYCLRNWNRKIIPCDSDSSLCPLLVTWMSVRDTIFSDTTVRSSKSVGGSCWPKTQPIAILLWLESFSYVLRCEAEWFSWCVCKFGI